MSVRLETERLILRRWEPGDRTPFARLSADPEVMEFFPAPLSREESDELVDWFVRQWDSDGFAFGVAERKADGAFVGMAGLARSSLEGAFAPCVEVGWRLARAHWGQGYATEAARGWLDYGFGTLGLAEIVAFTNPTNTRSAAVMQRLGMARDPARDWDHPEEPEGPKRHFHFYAISRAAWEG